MNAATIPAKRVTGSMLRFAILFAMIAGLSGCSRTRQFLHMDSNSSSPFLGLELSVDADDPRSQPDDRAETLSVARNSQDSAVFTAGRSIQTTRERYRLPELDLSKNPEDADEVYDLLEQISI